MEVMKRAVLRFYEELGDYLPGDKKKRDFVLSFEGHVSIADLLKAVGVPASEVDLALCDSESVSLEHVVQDGDRLSIYPIFELLDIRGTTRVRTEPLRRTRQPGPAIAPTSGFRTPDS
jgi:uncharacterized protein